MAKKLKIKLLPNGLIEMETIGVKGKKCMEYAKLMEEIANAKIKEQNFTDEYYEQEEVYDDGSQNIYEHY